MMCSILHNLLEIMSKTFLHTYAPQLSLILITLIWGSTFLIVQHALSASSPMFFVGCRFAAAAGIMMILSWKVLASISRYDVIAGGCIGIMIAIGYGAQTIGLQTISSSESAFLTALYVPMVPILQLLIFKKVPKPMMWCAAAFAFIGLILLTGNHSFSHIQLNAGQMITLFGAIAIAMEIILIGYFAERVNTQCVTVIQLLIASLCAFVSMPMVGEMSIPHFSWTLFFTVTGLGFASALIQLTMNWAQRFVDPSQAAIIYAGEPVWAGVFGRLAGERLGAMALLGGLCVVFGVILSEMKWSRKKKPSKVAYEDHS